MPARPDSADPSPSASPQAGPSRRRKIPPGTHPAQTQTKSQRVRPSQWTNGADDIFFVTDPEEKKRMGQNYRSLQTKVDDMKANAANLTFKDLKRQLEAQEDLFDTVRDTSIAALDANISLAAADAALHLALKLKLEGNTFDVDEFFIRLRSLLGLDRQMLDEMDGSDEDDELEDSLERTDRVRRTQARRGQLGDWAKIGWMAAKLGRRVPGAEFMYGPLKVEHKKRTIAHRRGRKDLAPEQRPQNVQPQQTQQQKDDTVNGVFRCSKLLKELDQGDGLNFFKFAINPDDFGQSVENVFYLSFLVKDGKAGLKVSEDGEMRIYTATPPEEEDEEVEGESELLRNQTVVEFDMETWKKAIEVFDIREPMIPHRTYQREGGPAQGAWY